MTTGTAASRLQDRLGERARVIAVPAAAEGLDLRSTLRSLGGEGVASVLCEGGGLLATSLLAADWWIGSIFSLRRVHRPPGCPRRFRAPSGSCQLPSARAERPLPFGCGGAGWSRQGSGTTRLSCWTAGTDCVFTGIVEAVGRVVAAENTRSGRTLHVTAPVCRRAGPGAVGRRGWCMPDRAQRGHRRLCSRLGGVYAGTHDRRALRSGYGRKP